MLAAQMLVESVLQRADVLLVGDPEVLGQMGELPADPGIVSTPAGNVVVLHNPGASSFVWVAGESSVTEVTVSLHLDALEGAPEPLGHIDCPSGRLIIGTPEAVAAWGDQIAPADGLVAQARAYTPDRRHCGLIVVARVEPGPRRVLAMASDESIDALVVDCEPSEEGAGMAELFLAG
jgi:hypothetical protein